MITPNNHCFVLFAGMGAAIICFITLTPFELKQLYSPFTVICLIFLFLLSANGQAQETVVKGKVTDAATGDGMPFVNIFFQGTTDGVSTDFDGNYLLKSSNPKDSIVASYLGYEPRTKAVVKGTTQSINFQLSSNVVKLGEVVVVAGENPAFPIIRKAIEKKDLNDSRSLLAYECESYSKLEVDIDNISDNLRKKRLMRKIVKVLDSLDRIAGEDGKPILPIYISETISRSYYKNDPAAKREEVLKTKVTGIGVDENSILTQILTSTGKDFNFYQDWLRLLDKDFVSPLSDSWRLYYDFGLIDSVYIGNDWCYQINVYPRREQDLAFTGTLWINAQTYALRQLDLTVPSEANLNYIDKVKIQQELVASSEGPVLPSKTRLLIDIAELNDKSAGMLAKIYVSNKDYTFGKVREASFYDEHFVRAEDVWVQEEEHFWEKNRHDSLSASEKSVYAMIDTIKKVPIVKSYIDVANIFINGYKKVGKLDIGPHLSTYAYNNIEGHRLQLGFRTNYDFSNKWIADAYAAVGSRDERIKYGASLNRIISRKRWTVVGIERKDDINQVAFIDNDAQQNKLFSAFSRFGDLSVRRPYRSIENNAFIHAEILKGLSQKVIISNRIFDPLYNFRYYQQTDLADSPTASRFTTTEFIFETRYGRDELFLQNRNERVAVGQPKWPIVTFRYITAFKNLVGSDFTYRKFNLNIKQRIGMGFLGQGRILLDMGYIPSTLPYPLLKAHLGNESPFFNLLAFNMMNYFEFISDTYGAFGYHHNFEGFLLNSIPLVSKLKWRLVASGNILYGGVSDKNKAIIPARNEFGEPVASFNALGNTPYAELSYGVENILRFIRVDFVHRLTYLENPGAKKFGVRVSVHFKL